MAANCELCARYVYDEDDDTYDCMADFDEDEMYRILTGGIRECPYFRLDDEYAVVRHQGT